MTTILPRLVEEVHEVLVGRLLEPSVQRVPGPDGCRPLQMEGDGLRPLSFT